MGFRLVKFDERVESIALIASVVVNKVSPFSPELETNVGVVPIGKLSEG